MIGSMSHPTEDAAFEVSPPTLKETTDLEQDRTCDNRRNGEAR